MHKLVSSVVPPCDSLRLKLLPTQGDTTESVTSTILPVSSRSSVLDLS